MIKRELKKIRIKRISIVGIPANRENWILKKSIDDDEDIFTDPFPSFPLVVPTHIIEKWEREGEKKELRKEASEKRKLPDDYPSIPLIGPRDIIIKMADSIEDPGDDDDEGE